MTVSKLEMLKELERKVLWLSAWMIHNANHLRENRDGLKVGGHQASCASATTIMTALYFAVLRAEDRVAVKPHAGPVFHAIQYLLGRQTKEKLEKFRGYGGAPILSLAHQGYRWGRFFHRLRGARRCADAVFVAGARLYPRERLGLPKDRKAA